MKTYSSKEIKEKLGITPRNLKFWIKEYNLKVIKKGRQNFFDENNFISLKLISHFSNNNFFTGKFLNIYLNKISNLSDAKNINELKGFINKIFEIEKESNIENTFLSLFSESGQIKYQKPEKAKISRSKTEKQANTYISNKLPDELL